VAASYYHDVEPCLKKRIPIVWVNRSKQQLEGNQKKPDAEVSSLREAQKLLGAS
jgi:2-haloacid dehalogenase/putative hydrolase of the HAD superfamily